MILKTGKIVNVEDNKKRIHFDNGDPIVDNLFTDSVYRVVSMMGRYDLEIHSKINEKEIFYIYDKNNNKDEIKEDVTNMITNGDISFDNENSSTIFWNVENQTIVIIGRESLYSLVDSFESERWRSWLHLFDQDNDFKNSIPNESLSTIYKKTIKILEKTP